MSGGLMLAVREHWSTDQGETVDDESLYDIKRRRAPLASVPETLIGDYIGPEAAEAIGRTVSLYVVDVDVDLILES